MTAKPLCTSETARKQCRRPVPRLASGQRLQHALAPERGRGAEGAGQGGNMAENEHPKGALLFILVFLILVVLFWINTYMRLWLRY